MANVRWKGGAAAVTQVATVQVTAYDAATTYKLTVNGKVVSVIAQGSVNATAAGLVTAWNASTEPEFAEVTASSSTDTVTLTADTAGVPFTATSSVSGGAGTIGAVTTTTSATGPYHWDNAVNWDTGAVPVNGDTVWIEHSVVSILYGLAQSAVTLTALNIAASWTGELGLAELNTSGSTAYLEYRSRYLAIGATTITIGDGPGQGSGRIQLNVGSVQCTLHVHGSGSGAETDLEPILWKGTHVSNVVNVTKGSVGIAVYGGESATVATLTVGYQSSPTSDSAVRLGAGVTLATLSQSGGTVLLQAGLTTVSKTGGSLTIDAGSVTTLTDDGGSTVYKGTGTITTLNVGHEASVDFGQDMRGRTVTSTNIYRGAAVNDPFATVTWTNPPRLVRCRVEDCDLDFGFNRTYAIGS